MTILKEALIHQLALETGLVIPDEAVKLTTLSETDVRLDVYTEQVYRSGSARSLHTVRSDRLLEDGAIVIRNVYLCDVDSDIAHTYSVAVTLADPDFALRINNLLIERNGWTGLCYSGIPSCEYAVVPAPLAPPPEPLPPPPGP